jgi:lysophospholipase L1-like esterase
MINQKRLSFLIALVAVICFGCSQASTALDQNSPGTSLPYIEIEPIKEYQEDVLLEENDWSSIWIDNANQSDKPRILFVGDSITDGYYSLVHKDLEENYYIGRFTTSKFLGNPDFQIELRTILNRYDFKIIQINNGLHGWDYSITDYKNSLEDLNQILSSYAPNARVIWCMTTPVRQKGNLDIFWELNQKVVQRNQIAMQVMSQQGHIVIDLYQEMLGHPEYYRNDGMHFNQIGKAAQAEIIISSILNIP